MSFLTQAAKQFLSDTSSVSMAHVVSLQLPGSGADFVRFTDFRKDLIVDGILYTSGKIKTVGEVRQTKSLSSFDVTINLTGADSSELQRALESEKYIGKEVTIRRVFLDHDDNIVALTDTSEAMVYFKGTIKSIGVRDSINLNGPSSSDVTWTCSSLLSNFNRVNGRITDDTAHRGLVDVNGVLVPSGSAKKVEYQSDKGFLHANQSINVLAQYQTKEKRYKLVAKRASGLKGLIGAKKYKQVEVWETVTKEVDLDINLTAKYLPIVYGVQRIPGIPVFMDTSLHNPNEIWGVYAFCEGEIDGFLDLYIDDKPIICLDANDSQNRVCLGRKRGAGDTISIATPIGSAPPSDNSDPSIHGEKYSYNDGNGTIDFWIYHGKSNQTACQTLVNKAAAGDFRLQVLKNMGPEYWDSSFKLLDTAYVVMRMTLNSERTTIPSIEAEVQGKKVRVYDNTGVISDNSTSLNFAWQTLDYLTSDIYGAGIPMEDIPLSSFIESAELMDIPDTSYQTTWVPYWRYLGWQAQTEAFKTKVQGSAYFDTSTEVFKNLQAILDQADASLNIVNGKYSYSVEALREPVADIHIDSVRQGSFNLTDTTSSTKFNSIQAAISDPANGWNTTAITFYNEQFLQGDNNVENKGNFAFPFITNYYTARARAERLLKRSRLTKQVSFALPFMYADLSTNDAITITHPRYGWDKKEFMIEDLRWDRQGNIQVTASEYARDVFINSDQSDNSDNQTPTIPIDVLPPTNLAYTPAPSGSEVGLQGTLTWNASPTTGVSFYSVRRSGTTEVDTVLVSPGSTQEVFTYLVRNLEPGLYTFQVRAVDVQGSVSAPATIDVDVNPSKNLPTVPNFRALNVDQNGVFTGSGVELAWDGFSETIVGLNYELVVMDSAGDTLRQHTLDSAARSYSYTLEFNKTDYATNNSGALGINRDLSFKIRAIGSAGAVSVSWATI